MKSRARKTKATGAERPMPMTRQLRPMAREMAMNVAQAKSRKKKRKKNISAIPKVKGNDVLGMYLNDVQKTDLLASKADELLLAEKLEKHEVEAWSLVLDSPKASGRLPQAFAALNKDGRDEIKYPTKEFKNRLEKCKALRRIDCYRQVLRASIDRLEGADRQTAETHYRASTQLRDVFVTSNLRLVVTMANRFKNMGSDLEDLIQEGNMGLIRAAALYDHTRNVRFSTFACWWIRHGIGRSLSDHSRTIRVPVHMLDSVTKVKKFRFILTNKLGREPTIDELAAATNLTPGRIDDAEATYVGPGVSLDSELGSFEDESRTFYDITADERVEHTAEAIHRERLRELGNELVKLLPEKQADVIMQRFGMDGTDDQKTLQQLGDKMALSRERIRQVQQLALETLRGKTKRMRIAA